MAASTHLSTVSRHERPKAQEPPSLPRTRIEWPAHAPRFTAYTSIKVQALVGPSSKPQQWCLLMSLRFSAEWLKSLLDQNSQSSSTDLIAHSNFSRSCLEKKRSIGTSNFFEKTTVRRGSM